MQHPTASLPPRSRRSLSARVVALVALASLVSALLPCALWTLATHRELRRGFDEAGPVALGLARERLHAQLDAARSEVEQVGSACGPAGGIDEPALAAAVERSPHLTALMVVDLEGNVQSVAGSGPELESLLGALEATSALSHDLVDVMHGAQLREQLAGVEEPSITVLDTPDQQPLPVASLPLRGSGGERVGALQGLLDREALREALPSELLGVRALASVSAGRGQLVAASGPAAGDPGAAGASGAVPSALVDLLSRGWSLRYEGPLEALGWTLVVEAPVLEAFEPLWQTLLLALALPPALALVFVALALWRGRRLARPLWAVYESLRAAACNEELREVDARCTSGEAGSLVEALNLTVQRMQAQRTESERDKRALREQNEAFRKRDESLSKITVTDPLTQVANRRYLDEQLNLEVKRLSRHNQGLSLLVIDVDDFKKLNDTFGHAAGDEFLKQIARILREKTRDTDLVARFGGEEFVVVAPDTHLDGALVLGEKVRTAVAEASFIVDASMRPRRATVSVGVAEFRDSRTSLFNAADAALYEAKSAGKNCVVAARTDAAETE